MCGFVGYLGDFSGFFHEDSTSLRRMADTIETRGPDNSGFWSDSELRIGLGHRRLSIVDL